MGKRPSNRQAEEGNSMSPHSIGADKMLATKLDRVERRARADRGSTFNNLGHTVDIEFLRQSYERLDGSKAVGIDGMTKEMYGKKLDVNLSERSEERRVGKESRSRWTPYH